MTPHGPVCAGTVVDNDSITVLARTGLFALYLSSSSIEIRDN